MTCRVGGGGFASGFYIDKEFSGPEAQAARQTATAIAEVQEADADGNTPLINALLADQPDPAEIERLLNNGARVSSIVGGSQGYQGCNALTLALRRRLPDSIVCSLIVKAKGEGCVNLEDQCPQGGQTPLEVAAGCANELAVEMLVIFAGAPVSASAFKAALSEGHLDMCKFLVRLGAPFEGYLKMEEIAACDPELLAMALTAGAALLTEDLEAALRLLGEGGREPLIMGLAAIKTQKNLQPDGTRKGKAFPFDRILKALHLDQCELLTRLGVIDQSYVDRVAERGHSLSFVECLRSGYRDLCQLIIELGMPIEQMHLSHICDADDRELLETALAVWRKRVSFEAFLYLGHCNGCNLLSKLGAPIGPDYKEWAASRDEISFQAILCDAGHIDMCKFLIKRGANMDGLLLKRIYHCGDAEFMAMALKACHRNQPLAVFFAIYHCPQLIPGLIELWGDDCLRALRRIARNRRDVAVVNWLDDNYPEVFSESATRAEKS